MIFINKKRFDLKFYTQANGSIPFNDWLKGLDKNFLARVQARVHRFEDGNFGDYKSVGNGVFEARLFFGPGYRVYFGFIGNEIVLLLTGGDKSGQSEDILTAKQFLKIYLGEVNANKK